MNLISTLIIWSWLLGFSLIVPTTLPAGATQKIIIEHRKNNIRSPLIAFKEFNLLSEASKNSSILTKVRAGTPIQVMKVWYSSDSEQWLLVNILSQNYYQLFYKRGWVHIGIS